MRSFDAASLVPATRLVPAAPTRFRRVLAAPLAVKLAGTHLALFVTATGIALVLGWRPRASVELFGWATLAACALAMTTGLVFTALRPLGVIERTARLVGNGDLDARVPGSALMDRDVARVGDTINDLLDRLTAERARTRAFAASLIESGDAQRARVGVELQEETAQSLTAITWQLGALARDAGAAGNTALGHQLALVKELTEEAVEHLQLLARSIYPRLLDDLGLVAALRQLARQAESESGIHVAVEVEHSTAAEARGPVTAALYHVASEAIRNAVLFASAERIVVRVREEERWLVVEVEDRGRGFDLAEEERRGSGTGLLAMRERMALVGGSLAIESGAGGTRVTARVPRSPQP